jgi:hypothetical protein
MTANKTFRLFFTLFGINTFLVVFILLTGCSGTSWTKPDLSALKPAGPPAKAVAVWEPAVKHETGQEPQRGFGGRVYFYDQESKKPIKINGNVVVYAFNEENRTPDDNAPTRSYLFDKSDVRKLYSKSKLGASYNFWVPWDSAGADGSAQKVSLIVRYIPEVGSSVVSSQAVVYLPGKPNSQTELMASNGGSSGNNMSGGNNTSNVNNMNSVNSRNIREGAAAEGAKEGVIQQVVHWDVSGASSVGDSKRSQPAEFTVESNNNRPPAMKISTIK